MSSVGGSLVLVDLFGVQGEYVQVFFAQALEVLHVFGADHVTLAESGALEPARFRQAAADLGHVVGQHHAHRLIDGNGSFCQVCYLWEQRG